MERCVNITITILTHASSISAYMALALSGMMLTCVSAVKDLQESIVMSRTIVSWAIA